jgi:hypothetical protein
VTPGIDAISPEGVEVRAFVGATPHELDRHAEISEFGPQTSCEIDTGSALPGQHEGFRDGFAHLLLQVQGHFVAATTDVGPEPGVDLFGSQVAHSGHGTGDNFFDHSLPACVDGADDSLLRGEQNRNTIGGSDHQHQTLLGGHQGVSNRSGCTGHDNCVATMHLQHVGKLIARGEPLQEQPQVFTSGYRRIPIIEGQVQALEGGSTDPAVPVGEDQLGGAEVEALVKQGGTTSLQEVRNVQIIVLAGESAIRG